MMILIIIYILILSFVLFWQTSLLIATMTGAPSVYANRQAVEDAFLLADLRKGETVIDLGCGDARSLIIATKKFGAHGIGIERSLYCYFKSKINVYFSGERKRIKILFGDFTKKGVLLKNADVVYVYLLNSVMAQKEDWFFENIGKNTRVVSLAFKFIKHTTKATTQTENLGRTTEINLYKS